MNQPPKRHRRLIRGSIIISTVSLTLVLLLAGVVGLINQTSRSVALNVRSNIGFVVLVDDSATPAAADSLRSALSHAPYSASIKYRSADEVLAIWQRQMGSEVLPDVNPFLAEYEVKVRPQWATVDSLESIAEQLQRLSAVYEDVRIHADIASGVNTTVRTVSLTLITLAALMLLISFVLINNTIRMEIYSQRTVIHTMQYVGATRWFIRRPYIIGAVTSGLVAAVLASGILAGALALINSRYPSLMETLGWGEAIEVFALLIAVGVTVCLIAAWAATSRYLYKDASQIFD